MEEAIQGWLLDQKMQSAVELERVRQSFYQEHAMAPFCTRLLLAAAWLREKVLACSCLLLCSSN